MECKASQNSINMDLCDAKYQHKFQNSIDSTYWVKKGYASLWSNTQVQLESYMQSSCHSLRLPLSSESLEYQPAPLHDHQCASYLNQEAKERVDYVVGSLDDTPQKTMSLASRNYRESLSP